MQDIEDEEEIETTEDVGDEAHLLQDKPEAKLPKPVAPTIVISQVDLEKQLTDFQRKLVHNVVYRSMDRATACRDAGSQAKSKRVLRNIAWETISKPHVSAYMNYLLEKKNEIAGIDKVEVIEGLRDILELARNDGKYKDALKALELLGSAIGLFKSVSQSTSIKKDKKEGDSAFLDDSEEDSAAKKDLSKLISLISDNQTKPKPTKK